MHWMCHIRNMKLMIFSFLTGSPIIFLTYVSMAINIDAIYFNVLNVTYVENTILE